MMAIKHRAYLGAEDLIKMQDLIAHAVAQSDYCGYVHVGDVSHGIYNSARHYNPSDVAHVWEDDAGDLVAWAVIYPRQKAFILQTTLALRGTDAHLDMTRWMANHTREWMTKIDKFGSMTTELTDGDTKTRKVLEQAGFVQGKHWINITLRPLDKPIPEPQFPEGFTVRSVEGIHEAENLTNVHSKSFSSSWTPEMYQKVMQSPGFVIENELVVVAPDGQFAAFCINWFDDLNKVALFEPVGTHEDFRRMGLARNMMYYAMHRMRDKGMNQAMVGHETDNEASTKLYASLGFEVAYKIHEYILNT